MYVLEPLERIVLSRVSSPRRISQLRQSASSEVRGKRAEVQKTPEPTPIKGAQVSTIRKLLRVAAFTRSIQDSDSDTGGGSLDGLPLRCVPAGSTRDEPRLIVASSLSQRPRIVLEATQP